MERFKENNYVTSHYFSKIELFVIVLALLLVAFVAIPKGKLMLEEIRINSAIDTAYSYKENVSKFYMSQLLVDNSFRLNGTYSVNNGNLIDELNNTYDVMISGNKPTSGILTYENNELKSGCIIINGYAVSINDGTMNYVDSCELTHDLATNI